PLRVWRSRSAEGSFNMVLACFVAIGHYGFWMPNEERGSGSRYVGSRALYEFGKATYVAERRRSRASRAYNRQRRWDMQRALKYPAVRLTGEQAWSVAQGIAKTIEVTGCTIYACCVMPDHTHLVIPRHIYHIEKLVIQLKGDATERLKADGRHPMAGLARPDG